MGHALLVTGMGKQNEIFRSMLQAAGYRTMTVVSSAGHARRFLQEQDVSLIVVNTPLPDEFGTELACYAAERTLAGVLMLVRGELADGVARDVEDSGVLVIDKPVGKTAFFQALRFLSAMHKRISGLRQENTALQNKIQEMRLINRAKCVLIQYLNMTEPQAHRYIEKQAMDLRITKADVSKNVLKTYEFDFT